jgi:hypothetical protein
MVRGLGGRNALKSMGAGRAKSPYVWAGRRYGPSDGMRLDAGFRRRQEGCNGRAPASPLPRWCCVSPHEGRSGSERNAERILSDNTHLARTAHGGNLCAHGARRQSLSDKARMRDGRVRGLLERNHSRKLGFHRKASPAEFSSMRGL